MLGRLRPNNLSEQGQGPTHQHACAWSSVAKLCLTLCNPMDCSPPGSFVHGTFQARILEWVAISSSRGPSHSRDWIWVFCISCIAGIKPESPALQADSLQPEPPRKPQQPISRHQPLLPRKPAQTCRPAGQQTARKYHLTMQARSYLGSSWALPCPLAGQCNLLDTLGQYPTVSGNGHPPHQWS